MRKKLLFLSVALALFAMPASVLTSCSGDEPTPMDKAKENVAGTSWTGLDRFKYPMTLKFKSDGTFSLDVMNSQLGFARGEYVQHGTRIEFNITASRGFWYEFFEGTISYGGGTLEIPMYHDDGDYSYTASLTLKLS